MDSTLNKLILMNVELEGLLRVSAARPSAEALEAARAKFESMTQLFASLTPSEAAAQADHERTEVKYDEAENGEESPEDEPSYADVPFDGKIIESDDDAVTPDAAPTASNQPKVRPDIRNLLTINDKFLFRRELFGGSDAEMIDTFNLISTMESADEAREYLLHDLQWNESDAIVSDFLQIVSAYFKS